MSENKSKEWFNLREFTTYLRNKNNRLYCEVLHFVSASVAYEKELFLDPEEGDWDGDDNGRMAVCLTDKDPHPDISKPKQP
jgi:hypothetical protein